MKPIEKNVIVVDEQGNKYEATWPRRAKGLVKNGRARFVSEHKICLACPPNIDLEDKNMSENKKNSQGAAEDGQEHLNGQAAVSEEKAVFTEKKLSVEDILGQIERMAFQTEYLEKVLYEVREIKAVGPGDVASAEKAKALGTAVKYRELTNQQILRLYEKMYDDLKPVQNRSSLFEEKVSELTDIAIRDGYVEELPKILGALRQVLDNR